MTAVLRVDPVRLRSVSAQESEVGSFLTGMAVGTSLSAAAAELSDLASGEACALAGAVVDRFHRTVGGELFDHADKLGVAADRYTDTDAELGRRLAAFTK